MEFGKFFQVPQDKECNKPSKRVELQFFFFFCIREIYPLTFRVLFLIWFFKTNTFKHFVHGKLKLRPVFNSYQSYPSRCVNSIFLLPGSTYTSSPNIGIAFGMRPSAYQCRRFLMCEESLWKHSMTILSIKTADKTVIL